MTSGSFAAQHSVDDSHVPADLWAQTPLAGLGWLIYQKDVPYNFSRVPDIRAAVLAVLWLRQQY